MRVREYLRSVLRSLRGHDVALHAAAVTFYSGVAVVPVALLTIRLAGLVAGPGRVRGATGPVIAAMPDRLGADRATGVLLEAGLAMSPLLAFLALLPATWYGEGLRRAFSSLAQPARPPAGWRGRLLILPLLSAGPVLLLGLLAVLPAAAGLLGRGGWHSVAAVLVSFLAVWLALSVMLIWVYRVVGPVRAGWRASLLGGAFTAANLSGFAHGFVLFWSLPLDLGVPFGGLDLVGAVVAVGLWLYLLHTLVLVGYAATLQLDRSIARGVPEMQSAESTNGRTVDPAAHGPAGS